ncbi:DNA primase family protein [Paracoccus laeviglucosivorans]|uniref:Putative DNA primase/helicase n=1 Tax=Paracoccus laeviglucosivorans TaxID=1197861 RepID=A0A521E5D8_9RHOB|nr:DNA primase family protein [Paracoccus laeviglucosivorans]SMO79153.1 putative DNA primase/helicase [Paracoccus laeviglucosivorans]
MTGDSDDDSIGKVRAVMQAAEDVDLPDGMEAPSDDAAGDNYPDDYTPPPPPPEDGTQSDEPEPPVSIASRQPLNDIGNGHRFRIHFGENILFVSQVGWFVWDGTRWKRDPEISRDCSPLIRGRAHGMTDLIEKEVDWLQPSKRDRQLLIEERKLRTRRIEIEATPDYAGNEELITELNEIGSRLRTIDGALKTHKSLIGRRMTHAKNAGNSGPMSNMINEARVMLAHAVDDMDRGDLDVNTLSGVLRFSRIAGDPKEGMSPMAEVELVPHDRQQLLTKVMPVEYDPKAECPRFDAFLQQIQPNIEMRRFLQRWFGLSMSGLDIQKLAFFHGGGANGKSVLVDLMARMMGDYAATAKIESLTGKNKKSGSDSQPDLIPLIGARMVRTSEPEEGERLQEGLVKALTGGEPMMVRALYTDMITFQPIFKLTISGNHLPDIRGGDDGIWRRLMLVTFPVQIAEKNRIPKKELDDILWAERSGILNWLVAGLLDYLEGGLREPEEVMAATEGYRKDSDPIGTFLADATVVTGFERDFMTARELMDAFNFWIEERGETRWSPRTVSLRLKAKADIWRHPDTQKTFAPGKSGVTGYRGIRLSEELGARMRAAEASAAQSSSGWPR